MNPSPRSILWVLALVLVCGFATSSFGQKSNDPQAATMLSNGSPGFLRVPGTAIDRTQAVQLTVGAGTVLTVPENAVTTRDALTSRSARAALKSSGPGGNNRAGAAAEGNDGDENFSNVRHTPLGGTIDGLDTVATFDGAFAAQAGPDTGNVFRFTMMGNHPLAGGTTLIPAKIDEVSLTLLNADGTVFKKVPFAPFEDLTLDSPNFEEHDYRSGRNIQYADAIHRAQFFHRMGKDWHTILRPRVVNRVNFTVPLFVNVRFPDGTVHSVQTYFSGTAADGSTFVLMLDLLFDFLFENEVLNEINAGNFTTKSLNTMLLPNTFLFSLNLADPTVPGGCCVLGFHTFFFDPSVIPEPGWVTQFASWISPGLFGDFQDVTALSHETSEAFADPFVDNVTPSWQFPGVPPTAHICQNNLEEGDPIEVLPVATVPITIRERHEVFTYHPQIIPLLQWFEMGATSNAIDGAFSFPNEGTLPHSALPCPP
jgi:hypothetical protein